MPYLLSASSELSTELTGVKPLLLDTQYRMHEGIAEFPSRTFYGSLLQTGIPASERPPPQVHPPNQSVSVCMDTLVLFCC